MQQLAIPAAAVGVALLGVVVVKKRSGKSDEEIKSDLRGAVRSILQRSSSVLNALHEEAALLT